MITMPILRTVAGAACVMALAGCSGSGGCDVPPPDLLIRGRTIQATLLVEIARTPAEQAKGLSGVPSLPPDDGMVFEFSHPTSVPFWMKDTTIPLSIAFWNSSGRIVDILDMTPCRAAPCRRYRSTRPFVGAVEVNHGYFRRYGIGIGDRVRLEQAACNL